MSGSTGSSLIIPKFVTIWIIIASILVTWDAAFVLSRPHSMAGGHLFWLFQPYAKYISVDLLYGNMQNSFVVAQAWLNIFEILGGVLSLIIYHGSKSALPHSGRLFCISRMIFLMLQFTLINTLRILHGSITFSSLRCLAICG